MNQKTVNSGVVNPIHFEFLILAAIPHDLVKCSPLSKFCHCKNMVIDIFNTHRAVQENLKQVLEHSYFSKISKLAN